MLMGKRLDLKTVTNRCVCPCMTSCNIRGVLENVELLSILQLVSEVRVVMFFKGQCPRCSRVSRFRAFKARMQFFCSERCEISTFSLLFISLKLSVQYFADCEVTMMRRRMLLRDTAVSLTLRDLFLFWHFCVFVSDLKSDITSW